MFYTKKKLEFREWNQHFDKHENISLINHCTKAAFILLVHHALLTLTCTSTMTHPLATSNILTKMHPIVLNFFSICLSRYSYDNCALFSMRCCGENKIKKTASVTQADGCQVRDLTARHIPMIVWHVSIKFCFLHACSTNAVKYTIA